MLSREESGHHNETVGHLPHENSRMSWYFLTRGKRCVEVTIANSFVEEWRLPVGWCSVVRVKCERFKIETAPLRPTTREKGNDQQQHAFSLLICLFSDILRNFYEY